MTDHDPMLDGITRLDDNGPSPFGMYVLFSDLPALIARVREDTIDTIRRDSWYEDGQRDEREACIAAVEAVLSWEESNSESTFLAIDRQAAIAAIRAREEKP